MAFQVADRVKQYTTSTGTGDISFTGTPTGFRSFDAALTTGDVTYYAIEENDKWEVGIGTYGSDNMVRNYVLASSNSDSHINLGGSGTVFITYPADKSVHLDEQSRLTVGASGILFNNGTLVADAKLTELTDINTSGTISSTHLLSFDNSNQSLLIGDVTGPSNSNNILIGYGAGSGITAGEDSVVIGTEAAIANDTGAKNVNLGVLAGPSEVAYTSSVSNAVSVGYKAGSRMRNNSTAVGYRAGVAAYEFGFVAVGADAGSGIGSYSVGVGNEAAHGMSSDYVVAVGYQAGKSSAGDSTVWVGNMAGISALSSSKTIGIGYQAGKSSSANDSIYIGQNAGQSNSSNDYLYIGNGSPSSSRTLIKGDMQSKRLAVGAADITLADTFYIGIASSSDKGLVIKSAASQSADLTQWQTSAAGITASMTPSGVLNTYGVVASGAGVALANSVPTVTNYTLYNNAGVLTWNGSPLAGGGGTDALSMATYASGQALENQGDLVYVSGIATYASGQAIENEGLATYASGQSIENEGLATYASGQAIENEADIATNVTDIVYVSGIAVYASGETTHVDDNENLILGTYAASGAVGTSDSIIIGYEAGQSDGLGDSQLSNIVGYEAFNEASGCLSSDVIGRGAGQYAFDFNLSQTIGGYAGAYGSGLTGVVAIGSSAGGRMQSSSQAVAIGQQAGYGSQHMNHSTMIGFIPGYYASGANNLYLGQMAGYVASGNYNIEVITSGNQGLLSNANNDHKINLESTIVGDTSNKKLAIGNCAVGQLSPNATLEILPKSSTDVGVSVRGAASHTANLTQWTTSANGVVAAMTPSGVLNVYGMVASGANITTTGSIGIGTDSPDYELDVAGDIGLDEYIYHNGDTNTYIRFRGDQIDFNAGGMTFLTLDEASNDKVIINTGGNDIDLRVEGENDVNLICTDAANDLVGIGTDGPSYKLDVFGHDAWMQASGVIVGNSGVVLADNSPTVTTNTLYNVGGSLYFNGSALAGGSTDTYTSGVATYASGQAIENEGLATYASGNTANISFGSNVEGDILYHNGTTFTRLAKGTDDYILKMNGNVPNWEAESGGGGVSAADLNHVSGIAVYASGESSHSDTENNLILGSGAASDSTAIGYYGLSNNNIIGYQAAHQASGLTSNNNIIGYQAGMYASGLTYNNLIGHGAGKNSTGHTPVGVGDVLGMRRSDMIGYEAGASSSGIDYCVGIGYQAAHGMTDAIYGIAIGKWAGRNSIPHVGCTYVGTMAGESASGIYNVYIGHGAGSYASGDNNIEIITSGNQRLVESGDYDLKLNLQSTIAGDTLNKKIAIGNCTVTQLSPDATLEVLPKAATDVGFIVQGAAAQSADLTQWQNSAGENMSAMTPSGVLNTYGVVASGAGLRLERVTPTVTTDTLYNVGGTLTFNGSAVGGTDTYTSGVATYASGQAIANETDLVYVSGAAAYSSGVLTGGIPNFSRVGVNTDTPSYGIDVTGGGLSGIVQATGWVVGASGIVSDADLNIQAPAIYLDVNDTTSNSTARFKLDGSVLDFYTLNSNAGPYVRFGGKTPGTSQAATLRFYETSSQYTFRLGDKDGAIKTYFGMGGATSQNSHWVMASDGGIGFSAATTPVYPDAAIRRVGVGAVGIYQMDATADGTASLGQLVASGVMASGSTVINETVTTNTPLTVLGASAQSADLTRWQNSAGENMAAMTPSGVLNVSAIVASGSVDGGRGSTFANIRVHEFIRAYGDDNTYLRFRGAQTDLSQGGMEWVTLDQASTDKVVINNGTNDIDFQVQGDSDTNLIRTDAANDRVGIGTSSPAYKLDIFGHDAWAQASGVSVGNSGVVLADNTPGATTNTLYNVGGSLYFNGSALAAGVSSADINYVSGIAVYASGSAAYASGQAVDNETDLAYVSGAAAYASGNTIVNDGLIAYASGNTANIAFASDVEGDILYHNGTSYIRLAKGTDNHVLTMNGNVPNWEAAPVNSYVSGVAAYSSGVLTGGVPNFSSIGVNTASPSYPIDVVTHSGVIRASGVKGHVSTNADASTVTFDLNAATTHAVTLGGNRVLAVSNAIVGDKFLLRLQQDSSGSRTVTWFSHIKWAGGSAPTLTTTAHKADLLGFLAASGDGSNIWYDGLVVGQNI